MTLARTLLIILVACAPAAAPAAAPADAPAPDSVDRQMSSLIADWIDAVKKHDVEFAKNVLAAEYTGIDARGGIHIRDGYLNWIRTAKYEVKSMTASELKARDYGKVVVLSLILDVQGTTEGKDDSGVERNTLVFVKRDGRWQCVASHASPFVKPT